MPTKRTAEGKEAMARHSSIPNGGDRAPRPSLDPEALEALVLDVSTKVEGTRGILEDHIKATVDERKAINLRLDAMHDLLKEILGRLPESALKASPAP